MATGEMSHEIRFGGGGPEDVLITTRGHSSIEGLDAMVQAALGDPRYRPGMRVLIDHSRLEWPELATDELRRRVDLFVRDSDRIGAGYIAIVVGQPAAFGYMRMMQAFGEHRVAFEPGVFYSIEDARAWLADQPPPSG